MSLFILVLGEDQSMGIYLRSPISSQISLVHLRSLVFTIISINTLTVTK
jgi:hypothetical protein